MENTTLQIGLQDLASMLTLIDAAAQRGTFQGAELTAVGALRDKLAAVVAHATEAPAVEEHSDTDDAQSA